MCNGLICMAIFVQLTTDNFRYFLHSQVVQRAKQKLNDYATETLASISKRFSHLHGLLQVAELQVIEKLRESSLPPQLKLNEAMGQLSGYETVIEVGV